MKNWSGHFSNIGMFRVHQQNKKMEIVYFVTHLFTGGVVFFKNRTDIISAIIAHLSNIFVHNMNGGVNKCRTEFLSNKTQFDL